MLKRSKSRIRGRAATARADSAISKTAQHATPRDKRPVELKAPDEINRKILSKPLRSEAQAAFVNLLKEARLKGGLTQAEVARRLGKPQSFVAKYEGSERRLDVLEFIAVARAIDADPITLIRLLTKQIQ